MFYFELMQFDNKTLNLNGGSVKKQYYIYVDTRTLDKGDRKVLMIASALIH